MVKKIKFFGGYRFKRFDGAPREVLAEMPIPEKVTIILRHESCVSAVKEGDSVKAGMNIIKTDDSALAPVVSSVNGVVEEIKEIDSLDGKTTVVTIKSDGSANWVALEGHGSDLDKLSSQEIESLLFRSGAASLGSGGIPTKYKTSAISPQEVDDLIITGVETDLYSSPLSVLLDGNGVDRLVDGVKILKKIMPNARVHIALTEKQSGVAERISSSLKDNSDDVEIYSLDSKYPQGTEEILVETLLDAGFPYGHSAANIGVVILDIQAVMHVYEAVIEGKPLIDRVVALCGPGFLDPSYVRVRIGSSIERVVCGKIKEGSSLRFIANSVMTGASLPDLFVPVDTSVSKIISLYEDTTRQFMAFVRPGFADDAHSLTFAASFFPFKKKASTNLKGEERPCVSCGFCQDVCPAGIIPHLLSKYAARGIIEETLVDLKIFNCIDCNLCSYVCPSKIEVSKNIRKAKKTLIEEGIDNTRNIKESFKLKGIQEPVETEQGK